ncbi:MAG: hypothetical protein E7167_00140 [Firmicutes bacterium]|nr:hypothetical protein [Bacillota bacterium]
MKHFKNFMILMVAVLTSLTYLSNVSAAVIEVDSEVSLENALSNGATEISLTNDITLTEDEMTHATRTVGLEIKGEDTITINGNGHKISTDLVVAVEIRANADKTVKVVFNDIIIEGTQRVIDTRSDNITLELNDTTLNITKHGNYQALTIGGNAESIIVNINNSTINGGDAGYGIITFNPVNMTINNSNIKGYAALYMKEADSSKGSAGSVVTIKNGSVLEGISRYSGGTDNFGTIVLSDINITISVIDSTVKAVNTGTSLQVPFSQSSSLDGIVTDKKSVIVVEGKSELIVDTKIDDESVVLNYNPDQMNVVIKPGVTANVEIAKEYLEAGTETAVDEETGEVTVIKRYSIILLTPENGTVKLDKEKALPGEIITINATANEDYSVDKIIVLDANGNPIEVKDGKFVMPNGETNVKVTFIAVNTAPDNAPGNPNTSDVNYTLLVSVLALGVVGIAIALKKRKFN